MKIQLVCVSVALVSCRIGFHEHPSPPPPSPPALCPAAMIIGSDENCPASGCGLNGIWLGDGVPFRTLHAEPGRRNEAGLAILDFRDARGRPLRPEVTADVLAGRRGTTRLTGDELRGAVLTLADPTAVCADDYARFVAGDNLLETGRDPALRTVLGDIRARKDCRNRAPIYRITFVDVRDQAFWETDPDSAHPATPTYQFSAQVANSDSCAVQVCRPGLAPADPDDPHGLAGRAVIFAGDYYDDHYRVLPGPTSSADNDLFNIACLGTTISKVHLMRHTIASRAHAFPPAQRQAMMSLLAADYCGDGHPFTSDGVALRIQFASDQQRVTPESQFGWDTCEGGCTLEATWAPDAHGAACIGTPRIRAGDPANGCTPTADGTRVICRIADHDICERPSCPSDTPAYLTSGTP